MIGSQIIAYLDTNGIGTTGDELFLGTQPEKPADTITIKEESSPVLPEFHVFGASACGIQVLVRNDSFSTGKAKTKAVHALLKGFSNEVFEVGGNIIRQTHIVTLPHYIGKDRKDRHEWSIHYNFEFDEE